MSDIKVYGAGWCEDTERTRHHLDKLGVPYEYHDVDTEPAAKDWVRQQNNGKQKTPTLDLRGRILIEPSDAELDEALKASGTPD